MLEVGDNILNGILVRVVVDPATGRTLVYIPLITAPSPDPTIDVDPNVTLAVLTGLVWLLIGTLSIR